MGFHRPPSTWPATVLLPYSSVPQPPVGHWSFNDQRSSPSSFLARLASTADLSHSACATEHK